ncbi:MAG: DUF2116 family Zn-ribbon domain-containing protein [Methanocellales archaeon]|nr:DUF2116 family Zn-ribbon domain-containing protein [Methanocellales archaeon]
MVKIIPHRHCAICGKSVESSEMFCSDECSKKYGDARKRQKLMFILLIVLMFVVLLLPLLRLG